jgi:hypothetical protein
MSLYRVGPLAGGALAASAQFHARDLPQIAPLVPGCEDGLLIVFPPADHEHDGWRLAAVQSLARESAPRRVNAAQGGSEAAVAALADYLARAPGITGQYWALDETGASGA